MFKKNNMGLRIIMFMMYMGVVSICYGSMNDNDIDMHRKELNKIKIFAPITDDEKRPILIKNVKMLFESLEKKPDDSLENEQDTFLIYYNWLKKNKVTKLLNLQTGQFIDINTIKTKEDLNQQVNNMMLKMNNAKLIISCEYVFCPILQQQAYQISFYTIKDTKILNEVWMVTDNMDITNIIQTIDADDQLSNVKYSSYKSQDWPILSNIINSKKNQINDFLQERQNQMYVKEFLIIDQDDTLTTQYHNYIFANQLKVELQNNNIIDKLPMVYQLDPKIFQNQHTKNSKQYIWGCIISCAIGIGIGIVIYHFKNKYTKDGSSDNPLDNYSSNPSSNPIESIPKDPIMITN